MDSFLTETLKICNELQPMKNESNSSPLISERFWAFIIHRNLKRFKAFMT